MRKLLLIIFVLAFSVEFSFAGVWHTRKIYSTIDFMGQMNYNVYALGDSAIIYRDQKYMKAGDNMYYSFQSFQISKDRGKNWKKMFDADGYFQGVTLKAEDADVMTFYSYPNNVLQLALSSQPIIFTTSNYGETWVKKTLPMHLPEFYQTYMNLAPLDTLKQLVYFNNNDSVYSKRAYYTTDGWKTIDSLTRPGGGRMLMINDSTFMNYYYYGAYFSRDKGKTWSKNDYLEELQPTMYLGTSKAIQDNIVFISVSRMCVYNGKDAFNTSILKSTDAGITWASVLDCDNAAESSLVDFDANSTGAAIIMAENSLIDGEHGRPLVYISQDFGNSWTRPKFADSSWRYAYQVRSCSVSGKDNFCFNMNPFIYSFGDEIITGAKDNILTENSNLKIYPNPVTRGMKLFFEFDNNNAGNIKVEIVSVMGQIIDSFDLKDNLSNKLEYTPDSKLTPGEYFLTITHGGKKITKSFIVND